MCVLQSLVRRRAEEAAQELASSKKQSEAQISELRQCVADAKLERERAVSELAAKLVDAESELKVLHEQNAAVITNML